MDLSGNSQLAVWLVNFGGNVVIGVIAVMLYGILRTRLSGESRRRESILIGFIFGVASLVAMGLTIRIAPGIVVDCRNIFLLVCGLFGGPLSALIAGAMTALYRIEIGGPGMPPGLASIAVACILGAAIAWRYRNRVRSFGLRELALIGLIEGALTVGLRRFYYTFIVERTDIPLVAEIALIVIFVLCAMALGAVMSATHFRMWWRTQSRLADILNLASDMVWETDVNENFVYVSERYKIVLGYSPDELIGRPPNAMGGRFDSETDQHVYMSALRARKPYDGVMYHMIAKDGVSKIFQIHGWPILDPRGRFLGYRGIARDVSEREHVRSELRRRDEQLRLSQEHFALAQQVGQIGSVEVDIATATGIWSDQMFRLLGLPKDTDMSYDRFLAAVHPEDRADIQSDRHALERGEILPPREYRIVRPDGAIRWIYRQVESIRDAAGTPVRHISTFVDITERKSIEAALRQGESDLLSSREHLARAQAIAHVGSAEVDLAGGDDRWSDELYRLIGIEPQSVKPAFANFLPFVHPDDREKLLSYRARSETGELLEDSEFRIIRPSGEVRWLYRQSDKVFDGYGRTVKILVSMQDITDRKSADLNLLRREEELQRNREHLALAQRVGKIGSSEVDFATGKTSWTDQLFALLGLNPAVDKPTFEAFLTVVPPEDRALAQRIRVQELSGIPSPPREMQIVRPGGERRWVYRQVEMIPGPDGRPKGMITTYQDVTDRRRMEEALQVSREHLALAQRIGRIGSAEVDIEKKSTYWSDGMFELLGLEPARTTPSGDVFLSVVHPDDRSLVLSHRSTALRGINTTPLEFRILRSDGSVRWIYHKVDVVFGIDGNPQKLIGIDQDITELKKAMQELGERDMQYRDSQKHLALAQRIGKIGSVEIDLDTGMSRWSEEMFMLLGLDPATTKPSEMTLLSVIHPDDRLKMRQRRERIVRGETNPVGEFRIVRADTQEVRWMQAQSGPAEDRDLPNRAVGTFQDITDLKLAQTQRADAERQLAQAQKMEAVGNLTGGIAHDFNNLLNVILGRLDLLDGELAERPELQEWVRICAAAARRGAGLTRNMMAFARQQPLQPRPIDLDVTINEIAELLQRTLGAAIELKVVCQDGLWVCEADPSQLQSAVLNLALNARDAMSEGGKLTIDVHNRSLSLDYAMRNMDVMPGDYVVIAITDTGCGMSAAVIERAFEPFFTTKDVGKGSGLGLSMVYGFVKQSGGHVKIYSEIGHGTTVRIYVPRSDKDRVISAVAAPQPVQAANGDETILVVEDDADMRALAVAVLERLGYTLLHVRDADAALPLFAEHPEIALLLTDISLPGSMNGRRLAERLQEMRPSLKVLYMSGYSEDAIIHQGRLDPGVRLLQKPFQNEDLAIQVRAALTGS